LALPLGLDRIRLNTEWIPAKQISFALIVEGIEEETEVVFIKNLITLGDRCVDLVRIVVGVHRQIEKPRVIAKVNNSWLGRFSVVAWIDLVEVFQDYCLPPLVLIKM